VAQNNGASTLFAGFRESFNREIIFRVSLKGRVNVSQGIGKGMES
jgi:hypothetical protein